MEELSNRGSEEQKGYRYTEKKIAKWQKRVLRNDFYVIGLNSPMKSKDGEMDDKTWFTCMLSSGN